MSERSAAAARLLSMEAAIMKKTTKSIETFCQVGDYELSRLEDKEPSCFNSRVSIRRYRVTVEEIEEPKEVLIARLHQLWRTCDNHHHWVPLQAEAKKLGIELSMEDLPHNRPRSKRDE